MKVQVTLSIDMDVEAYENTYGPTSYPHEKRADMVRRDLREHVLTMVQSAAPFGTGEVPATIKLGN